MSLRHLLLHDMGRKGLALGLATGLWYLVFEDITVTEELTLTIQEQDRAGSPDDGAFEVRPPPGWVLTSPVPGSTVQISFRGPRSALRDFFRSEPGASFKPELRESANWVRLATPRDLDPASFLWTRSSDAQALLADVDPREHPLVRDGLEFEEITREVVELSPDLWPSGATAAEGYQLIREDMRLDTTSISLEGPFNAIEALRGDITDWKNGLLERPPAILEDLPHARAREDIVYSVGIAASLRDRRIVMRPETVRVTLPVRLENLAPVKFTPDLPKFIGEAPGGDTWEHVWTPQEWTVELSNRPGVSAIDFNEEWVRRHVILFVRLSEIPADADEYDLPVYYVVTGEQRKVLDALRGALTIKPQEESGWVMKMTRTQN